MGGRSSTLAARPLLHCMLMHRLAPVVLGLLTLSLGGCLSNASVRVIEPSGPVLRPAAFEHGDFNALLADVVDARGFVDYAALVQRPAPLDSYLRRLAATDPSGLPEADRLAFWINVYNAYTLQLVVDNYPVESILDVVSGPFIPTVNSPFRVDFVRVGGETMTLDEVEHSVIREEFDEPRIHFAVVCAARSCPPLRAEAYTGDALDAQLDDQARTFLHNPDKNRVPSGDGTIALSKILDWYAGDFGGSGEAVQAAIAPYFEGEVRATLEQGGYDTEYLDYDWSLNDTNAP